MESPFYEMTHEYGNNDQSYMSGYLKGYHDATMKEREHIVRCKDCKHYFNGCCYSQESNRINFTVEVPDDWFCADGVKKE